MAKNPFKGGKMKEGSKAEESLDRKQDKQGKKGMPAFKKGGKVKK